MPDKPQGPLKQSYKGFLLKIEGPNVQMTTNLLNSALRALPFTDVLSKLGCKQPEAMCIQGSLGVHTVTTSDMISLGLQVN
jgi:hypothetical protein